MPFKARLIAWLDRSVGNRLTFASVVTALTLAGLLGMAAFPLFFQQAWKNFENGLENDLDRFAERFEFRLGVVQQTLGQLARNSFVINALVDSTGREVYLQPTLRDFRLPFDIASDLVVFDANLHPFAGNYAGHADPGAPVAALARETLREQRPRVALLDSGEGRRLAFAFPIYYPPATAFEGVLVGTVEAGQLFRIPDLPGEGDCLTVAAAAGPLLVSGCDARQVRHSVRRALLTDGTFAGETGLSVVYGRAPTAVYSQLAIILLIYLAIGSLAVSAAHILSRRLGRQFVRQLDDLSSASRALTDNPAAVARVEWNRPDEIGRFAKVFNRMVGTLQDFQATLEARVLERTRALARSERDYASLAEAAPVGIFRTDGDGRILYVNVLWTRLTGLSEVVALGAAWDLGIHPDDREEVAREWSRARAGQGAFRLEYRLRRPDGEVTWVLGQALAMVDEAGRVLGQVGTVTDISERKRAEEQARLLSTAVAQSNASVVMTDLQGYIIFVNDAFTRTTGFSREEVLGQHTRLLGSGLTPVDIYQQLWETILQGRTWRGEFRNKRKNGEIYWESATISPVLDGRGQATHFIGIQEDISERKRHEVELRQAKEEAEAANLAKSQFLATMSHEIRTPMNGILGMAQLLLMPELDAREKDEYARTILNSGTTLQALLDDILDLSKVEAGKLELQSAVFDPSLAIDETAALFRGPARQKGVQVEAQWRGPAAWRYWTDPIRVRQMLSNLVSNAIKFTSQGFVRIEGEEVGRHGNEVELLFAVVDTGIGIPADKLDRLFLPFSQVDNSSTRKHGGTGLGLSIVRRLAHLMGGEAGVDSEAGKGSRFWFRIRVQAVGAGGERLPPGEAADVPEPTAESALPGPGRILMVEDNPINSRVIEAMLTKQGYRVQAAKNGREALDAVIGGQPFDLVLMDCQMPVMDGFEATREIRLWERASRRPRLPVVALTAGAFEEDRQSCLAGGMDDFLAKPVDMEALLATLDKWLKPRAAGGA